MLAIGLALMLGSAQASPASPSTPTVSPEPPTEVDPVTVTGRRTPNPDRIVCVRVVQSAQTRIGKRTCDTQETWAIYRDLKEQEARRALAVFKSGKSFAAAMSTDMVNETLISQARYEAQRRRQARVGPPSP